MVISYLEKIREKFQENRYEVNAQLSAVLNKQKENAEIIKLLEVNDDPNFESFTPRNVNSFNKSKIAELKQEQKELEVKIDDLKEQLDSIEKEIDEVSSVIRYAKEKSFD